MANQKPPSLAPEELQQLPPRQRARLATRNFGTIYLGALIFLVLTQFSLGGPDSIPVLRRLWPIWPTPEQGWMEIPLGVGAGLFVILLQVSLRRVWTWLGEFDRAMMAVFGKLRLSDCVLLAATSGLAEEVAFRGMLQNAVGIVVASLLFGLAHFLMWQWAAFAAAMGFLFGGLYILTGGGLLAPFLAHFTINLYGLYTIARDCPEDGVPPQAGLASPPPAG